MTFNEVAINYDTIFLNATNGNMYRMYTFWKTRIGDDVIEPYSGNVSNIHKIYYSKICNQVKMVTGCKLFSTRLFVSHNHILSIFDVVNLKWLDHMPFEDEINYVFKNVSEFGGGGGNMCLLMNNGTIKTIGCDEDEEVWTLNNY